MDTATLLTERDNLLKQIEAVKSQHAQLMGALQFCNYLIKATSGKSEEVTEVPVSPNGNVANA